MFEKERREAMNMTDRTADALRKCTGARTVTHYEERRNADGTITAEAVTTSTRSEGRNHWLWRNYRTFTMQSDLGAYHPTHNVYNGVGYLVSRHETIEEANAARDAAEAAHIAKYPASTEPAYTD